MTKEELITKQQLRIEELEAKLNEDILLASKAKMKFICIGAPLNDNLLQFNKPQLIWAQSVLNLIEQISD